jgi:hypothetical protein
MKFRTEINLPPATFAITHRLRGMAIGSCFAESISRQMLGGGLMLDVNPFGTLYNPLSIAAGVQDLIDRRVYREADVFFYQGAFHSFSHHSRFSGPDGSVVLAGINGRIDRSSTFLQQADYLMITFGTANVFRLSSDGQIVANCHKRPAADFVEQRLSVEGIVDRWRRLLSDLRVLNPRLKILFTVSPIRHLKQGLHENQLSKAVLLLAVEELLRLLNDVYYFPAYEMVLDDLRDYRFYASDLVHPNAQAEEYVWEKFMETYCDASTRALIDEAERRCRAANHRPIIGDANR